MSALTSVCGWPRFRWPPLLPVHIHLTIESGKRKPSGECFRFPLRWASWNVLPRKRRIIRLAGHAIYGSDFVSGWRFPSVRRTGWKKQKSRAEDGYAKKKAEEKAPVQEPLPVCYSFPSASSATISAIFDGKPSYSARRVNGEK